MAEKSIPHTNDTASSPRLFALLSEKTDVKHLISGRTMSGFEIVFLEMHIDDLRVAGDDLAKTLYALVASAGDELERCAHEITENSNAIGIIDAASIIGSLHSAVGVEITRRKLNADVRLEELVRGVTA